MMEPIKIISLIIVCLLLLHVMADLFYNYIIYGDMEVIIGNIYADSTLQFQYNLYITTINPNQFGL